MLWKSNQNIWKKPSYVDTEFYFLRPLNWFFPLIVLKGRTFLIALVLFCLEHFIPSTEQLIYFHLVVEINIKLDIVLCSGGYYHFDSSITLSVRIPKDWKFSGFRNKVTVIKRRMWIIDWELFSLKNNSLWLWK